MLADFASLAPSIGVELSVAHLGEGTGDAAHARLRAHGVVSTQVRVHGLRPSGVVAVRRHLAAARPDLVHTHLKYADVIGGLAARSLGLPVVSTLHEAAWRGPPAEHARQRIAALVRRHCADRVVAVSDAARASYLATGWDRPDRVAVVRNGIPSRRAGRSRAEVREQFGLPPGAPVLAMVSALRPEKGHEIAFEAFRRLRAHHPDARLLVAGDGPRRPALDRLAGPGIVMAGHQDDVASLLGAADLLLHPSHVEAFPTSLLEAMQASLPVVATGVGGIPEIVDDGTTGMLVAAPPEPGAVAAAAERLLADPDLGAAMGAAAAARFAERFGADVWLRETRAVYDAVMAARGSEASASALVRAP
jgi:glycosyltransferase involved in cell wall biosynthesis